MNRQVTIKNLYAGKPDAKDQINSEEFSEFIKSYVIPDNIDIERVIKGDIFYITGYKGTGKTALLFFIDEKIKDNDSSSCSSFIFFKEEFSELKKQELESLSKRLLSTINIESNILLDRVDFEYVWKWIIFKRIIFDNELYNGGLFVNDRNWFQFKAALDKIVGFSDKKKFSLPAKIKLSCPVKDPISGMEASPELELDLNRSDKNDAFGKFVEIIEEAEELFAEVNRTDIPYHVFIDELEAYFGDREIFFRDLYIIRDLIITVKKVNTILRKINNRCKSQTKIICSVRTEIINAIHRFIVTKEINKITLGYEFPLIWDYNNTNSIQHPIFKILLKRIRMSSIEHADNKTSDKMLYEKWFPEHINSSEPVNYVLNNGWNKPRDIVRLITASQNSIHSNSGCFSQAVFDSCQKRYSIDSLIEIKEEMRALYSPDDIDCIVRCLTGFRIVFSMEELERRIAKYFNATILSTNLNSILNDIYRLGIIGNYSTLSRSYRWQHKGDEGIIISDEWSIIVHQALQNSLSISRRHDAGVLNFSKNNPQEGEEYEVTVYKVLPYFLLVQFFVKDKLHKGSIHISKLSYCFVKDINEFAKKGDKFRAKVLEYDPTYTNWRMSIK